MNHVAQRTWYCSGQIVIAKVEESQISHGETEIVRDCAVEGVVVQIEDCQLGEVYNRLWDGSSQIVTRQLQ